MSEVGIQVGLLIDTLLRKKELLIEIKQYTENQKVILSKEAFDMKAFNVVMRNKQMRIDLLQKLDTGFESTFERVKNNLTTQSDIYKEDIIKMKALITEVNDLGIDIQVQEERNRTNFKAKSKNVKTEVKTFRTHKNVMKKYQDTYNSQKKADAPHFFDSKK